MEISYERGIVVEADNFKLYLDPELSSTPIKYPTLVTHAHSDHTAAITGAAKTYVTKITLDLFNASTSKRSRNYLFKLFYEPFELGPFEIEYLPAGHLLGAAQILVRKGSETFLYTGDFCPEPLLTVEGAKIPNEEIDLTVMDATYGNQLINFDSRVNIRQELFIRVISEINNGKIPLINVGHLGGAQEVIKLFNNLTNNLPILVNKKVEKVCKVFEEHGISLNYFSLNNKDFESFLEEKCIIVVPRSYKAIKSLISRFPILKKKLTRIIVTGQSAKYGYRDFDYASALSTHANFTELIEVAKEIQPKHILTHYGYHKELARSLSEDHNIPANSFENTNPINLKELKGYATKFDSSKSFIGYSTLDDYF